MEKNMNRAKHEMTPFPNGTFACGCGYVHPAKADGAADITIWMRPNGDRVPLMVVCVVEGEYDVIPDSSMF
ncbi:hypothetical protein HYV73_00875 [Candidatus Uhrbacteria bacterium]|nr:hypothetical protein [Candidatus Uhrbacteria bacterium]